MMHLLDNVPARVENIEHFGDEKKDSQNGNAYDNENGKEWEIMNCKQIKCIDDTKYEMIQKRF